MNTIATEKIVTDFETQQETKLIFSPEAPNKLEDLDIPHSLVEDLMLRYLYTKGSSSILGLKKVLKLSFPLLYEIFQQLRQKQFFEITGMEGSDYNFTLSGIGRETAEKRFKVGHYSGPAPVSLKKYNDAIRTQEVELKVNRQLLKSTFSQLVLSDSFLDQLGPALSSQKPIFIYGPTGNGKTSVASQLSRIYQDSVLIPYAVEVDGQIIVVYDPVIHERLDCNTNGVDQRWVLCRRPCIISGGELEPNMFDLKLEESTKVYSAPLQLKANNGILVIDDFGRQTMSPEILLNRWIVPLDRKVDYLTLSYGLKFEIPFVTLVVFSTNLDPNDLVDEAFLRRIPNKIHSDAIDAEVFDKILYRLISERNIPFQIGIEEILRELCLNLGASEFRACYPRDIIDIIQSISDYEEKPIEINEVNLKRATKLYFTKPNSVSKQKR